MWDVLFATRNRHKFEEVRYILASYPFQLHFLGEFPEVPLVEETGRTFEENALLKARVAFQHTGLWTLADDSGLEVDALQGAPGIYSARFASDSHDYAANNRRLLEALAHIPDSRRGAQFRCVVAIVGPNFETTVEGIVLGRIIQHLRGEKGFGYDPLFVPEGYNRTFAELGEEVKNRISHRAQAFQEAARILLQRLSTTEK